MQYKKNKNIPRKSDTITVGNALRGMLGAFDIDRKYDETQLINSWEKMMGKTIANRTSKIFINNKKMYVTLTSAPLKNELALSKQKVLDIFEKEVGKGIVNDIVFL